MTALLAVVTPQHRWRPHEFIASFVAATLLFCATLQPQPVIAATGDDLPTQQQVLFWEARKAIKRGHPQRFERYASQLKAYPLYPYLIYWQLLHDLPRAEPEHIEDFLSRYADLPLATRLRNKWLRQLARQHRWQEYLRFYVESNDATQRCHYYFAQHQSGHDAVAWKGAQQLWMVGYSQDKACDPLFVAWHEASGIDRMRYWQRIELLMQNGETRLADYLAKSLPQKDRRWLSLWIQASRQPERLLDTALKPDSEMSRRIIFHTLLYRAPRSPAVAAPLWTRLKPRYAFTAEQRHAITRAIALGFAYNNDTRALRWFNLLPAEHRDPVDCKEALRVALSNREWGKALAWIQALPDGQGHTSRNLYWRGRIYEKLGFPKSAHYFYRSVSNQRDYYGFLAADQLDRPYNLKHDPLQVSDQVITRVAQRVDMVRAKELYQLGLIVQARREWELALSKMSRMEMLAASLLAHRWGWQDRAILTLARADHFDDLQLRFPLSYKATVKRAARDRAIDPAWAYAVLRYESAMMPNVESPVGALGLMQLMPRTGRHIARQLRITRPSRYQMLEPAINIRLGTYYLKQLLEQFDNNPIPATAAYNAGPPRVRSWFPEEGSMEADLWVESIPFDETRKYVRMVMAYTVFYQQRLGQPIMRLKDRMKPVGRHSTLSHCSECTR